MEKACIIRKAGVILYVISIFRITYASPSSKGNYFFPEIGFKDIRLKELDKKSANRVVKRLKDYRRIFDKTDIFDTVNHFYASDIDNDNTDELIYYGIAVAEGYWTIIWKAEHETFRLLGELYGKIIGVSDSLHIATLAPPCCGSDCGYANLYRIADDWIDFLRSVAIFKGMSLPDSPPVKKNIVINSARCGLQARPVNSDTAACMKIEPGGVLNGKGIVDLEGGANGWVTAVLKDGTAGVLWMFVVLDDPQNARYNVYKDYKKENRQICGWIIAHETDYKEIR